MGFRTVRLNEWRLPAWTFWSRGTRHGCTLGEDLRQNFGADSEALKTIAEMHPIDRMKAYPGWVWSNAISVANDNFVEAHTPENRAALEQACLGNRLRIIWKTDEPAAVEEESLEGAEALV